MLSQTCLASAWCFTRDNIWRFPTKTGSYQQGLCNQPETSLFDKTSKSSKSYESSSGKSGKSDAGTSGNPLFAKAQHKLFSKTSSKKKNCDGVVPNMLGEFYFWGFRFEGVPAADMESLQSWTEGMGTDGDGVPRPISGIEWVPWTDGSYYMLAINSPAGLVRRFCTFNPWNNRTSTCTGVDYRDEAVTELLEVTELDEDCNAMAFGIVTTKSFVPGAVCGDGESPPNGNECTAISNMFVDKVQGVRTRFDYPKTPADMDDFTRRRT